MEILKMKVNWKEGFANSPTLQILVSDIPIRDEMEFTNEGQLYFAEKDGYVSFFAGNPEKPGRGFGGREFLLKMVDGSTTKLVGPFSSRASEMNAAGFIECMDVSITDDLEAYEQGYTFMAGHVTVKIVQDNWHKLLNPLADGSLVYLIEPVVGSEDAYKLSVDPEIVMKPSERKRDEAEKAYNPVKRIMDRKEKKDKQAAGIDALYDGTEGLSQVQADIVKHTGKAKPLDGGEKMLREEPLIPKEDRTPEEALEHILQMHYDGNDLDDLNLTKMMKKEMQYNALIRWLLAGLNCGYIEDAKYDELGILAYRTVDLDEWVAMVEKALKVLEK